MQADIDKYQRNGGNMVKAIVGANWGDEGKGKITDMLAEESDIIVRFRGGSFYLKHIDKQNHYQ